MVRCSANAACNCICRMQLHLPHAVMCDICRTSFAALPFGGASSAEAAFMAFALLAYWYVSHMLWPCTTT